MRHGLKGGKVKLDRMSPRNHNLFQLPLYFVNDNNKVLHTVNNTVNRKGLRRNVKGRSHLFEGQGYAAPVRMFK